MSIVTVLWTLAVAGLVTGVAAAASAALRRMHRPERWVWMAALGVTAALPFLPAPAAVVASGAEAATVTRMIPIAQMVTLASASLPEPARVSVPWIPLLWGAASFATVLAMLGGAWSLARRRERWPRRRIDGDLLRVSDRFGPAVVGWINPEIVLPEWAVGLGRRERRLILRHENEHRWARDPQLLALGVLLLAAAPWNPFAWLQFRGRRRAVEFDCDARVLDSGASPRAYGRLLLSVQLDGGRRGALFAPALREPASFLERRLQTMKLRDRPIARLRVAGLALVAVVLTVVACETPRPTESEPVAAALTTPQVAAARDSYRARIERLAEEYEKSGFDTRWRLDGAAISAPGAGFDYGQVQRMMSTATNPPDGEPLIMIVELFTDHADQLQYVDLPPDEPATGDAPALGEDVMMLTLGPRGAVQLRRGGETGIQTITAAQVRETWEHDARSNPDLAAIVRVDPDTPTGTLDEVLVGLRSAGATRISVQEWPADYSERPVPALHTDSTRSGPVPALRSAERRDGPVPGLRSRADTSRSIELWRPDGQDSLRLHTDTLGVTGDSWGIEAGEDGKRPLIYVDGIRVEWEVRDVLTDHIRPEDIERIEVIRGSTARELYGAEAEGGIIQIFTKKND